MSTPVILDANSLIMRCVMASARSDLDAGIRPTGGVYGSLNTLCLILTLPGLDPSAIYACFDAGIPARRFELLPDYKQRRSVHMGMFTAEEEEEVFAQMGLARKMFDLLGVVCLRYKDREADDVVAACTRVCVKNGQTPLVITGDRDLWQTVGLGAQVWDLNKRRIVDADTFANYVGVPLRQYLLFKAMVGDASDSILGAPGVGVGRAAQLLDTHDPAGTPRKQLDTLVAALQGLAKRRKFEQSVVDAHDHLHRVLQAIDLSRSFGRTTKLAAAMQRRPACALIPFLRFCRKLQLGSVLRDPHRFFRPFRHAMERRAA